MINFVKEHNPSWPQCLYHPCRTLKTGGSESGKRNSLFKSATRY